MELKYIMISTIIGIITGMFLVHINRNKIYKKEKFEYKFKKSKIEFNEYQNELINCISYSSELLNNIVDDCQKLYKHITLTTKNVNNSFAINNHVDDNISHSSLKDLEKLSKKNNFFTIAQPRDYSENKICAVYKYPYLAKIMRQSKK